MADVVLMGAITQVGASEFMVVVSAVGKPAGEGVLCLQTESAVSLQGATDMRDYLLKTVGVRLSSLGHTIVDVLFD